MALATCPDLDTIAGIVEGRIAPETLPFASMSAGEQRTVIAAIDAAMEDIEAVVLDKYPDLEDENQRAARVLEYRREYLARCEDSERAAAAQHFDVLHGVLIRDASASRTYSVLEDGTVGSIAAA